jgi:hypothetical protein
MLSPSEIRVTVHVVRALIAELGVDEPCVDEPCDSSTHAAAANASNTATVILIPGF